MTKDYYEPTITADARQLYYWHIHNLKMKISEYAIQASLGDIDSLLLWCSALLEMYRNLNIPDEQRQYYEKLMEIEDEILELKNILQLMKTHDEALRFKAQKNFIQNYSRIQKELHEREIALFKFRFNKKMEVPISEEPDPFTKWEKEAGALDEEDEYEENTENNESININKENGTNTS